MVQEPVSFANLRNSIDPGLNSTEGHPKNLHRVSVSVYPNAAMRSNLRLYTSYTSRADEVQGYGMVELTLGSRCAAVLRSVCRLFPSFRTHRKCGAHQGATGAKKKHRSVNGTCRAALRALRKPTPVLPKGIHRARLCCTRSCACRWRRHRSFDEHDRR
ncbi:hypothetical protein BD413DRAFT_30647 [Trametes elegans]|nr:hypothetical protein BD413DRAFT_30647 [Trametes elegans]